MQSDFFELENKLADQLSFIKDKSGLVAVKAEFEAEGSSFRDLIRLRVLTARKNVPYTKDAMELGVDGLIAPMVGSPSL